MDNSFALDESHHMILDRIENEQERRFYETEAIKQQWDSAHLQWLYDYGLFDRYAISCDKDALMKTAQKG
jgi:predicted nuclease of restriction endonuclease-like (RecB) superfamily